MSSISDNEFGGGTSFGSFARRDSFERFNENLTETILSFMTFRDKVLFEPISRLWSQLIYNRQKELQLFGNEEEIDTLQKLLEPIEVIDFSSGAANKYNIKAIKKEGLKNILKKCKSIETIYFHCYCDEEVLQILGEYCPKLKTFQITSFGLTQKSLTEFGAKYGHQFERIELYESDFGTKYLKKFLEFCPNVKRLHTENLIDYICDDKDFLPNINEFILLTKTPKLEVSTILKNKYRKNVNYLMSTNAELNANDCKQFILNLSELQNLNELYLSFYTNYDKNETIDEEIIQLSKGCHKLKTFELSINGNGLNINRLLICFESFRNLQSIDLDFEDCEEKVEGSVKCFESCKNLKILNLFILSLKEEFFDNIDQILPNLEEFCFSSNTEITDKLINRFSKLPKLRSFELFRRQYFHKHITDESVCRLINSCKSLALLRFNSRPNISHKTIDALISHVIKNTKISFQFNCGMALGIDHNEIQHIDQEYYQNIFPANLEVTGNFW